MREHSIFVAFNKAIAMFQGDLSVKLHMPSLQDIVIALPHNKANLDESKFIYIYICTFATSIAISNMGGSFGPLTHDPLNVISGELFIVKLIQWYDDVIQQLKR